MTELSTQQINEYQLRRLASRVIFQRGRLYYQQGRVELVVFSGGQAHLHVTGTTQYCVDLQSQNATVYFYCTCPYAESGNFCKHMVAAGLFLHDYLIQNRTRAWKSQLRSVFTAIETGQRAKPRQKPYLLLFSLQNYFETWRIIPFKLEARFLPESLLPPERPLKSPVVMEILEHNSWLLSRVKPFNQKADPGACINGSPEQVDLANLIYRNLRVTSGYYSYNPAPIEEYLTFLERSDALLYLGTPNSPFRKMLKVADSPGVFQLEITRRKDGVSIQARLELEGKDLELRPGESHLVSKDPLWGTVDGHLVRIENTVPEGVLSIFFEQPQISVPPTMETEFLEEFIIPLANALPLKGTEILWEEVRTQPLKRLYLTENRGKIVVQLRFCYGEFEVDFDKNLPEETVMRKPDDTWTLVKIKRDPELESEIFRSLSSSASGLKRGSFPLQPGEYSLRAKVDPVDFLLKKVPRLTADGFEIYGEENLKSVRVNRNAPTVSFSISSGIDWFDIQAEVMFGDVAVSLQEVRKVFRKKGRFVKLADGSIGEIPEEWIENFKHLFGLGELSEEKIRLTNHHVTLIDQLMSKADEATFDQEYEKRLNRLRDFTGIREYPLPAGFSGELRPYQKAGVNWLHFLHEYGFGGCLADDMGLGKTVQILVFLLSLKETSDSPQANLVIVPRSLMVNWQREAARFTPGLSIYPHFGPARQKDELQLDGVDIVLTTYGTMRRDIHLLRNYRFHYVILDESQAIKNPMAQVSKASRLLNSDHRMVLTGTPVENSTFELWSQFAFLNPGLLGSLEYFKREFANPIERKQEEAPAELLRKLVFPFILRRTKSMVAPELPPRTERVLYSDMDPAQRNFYKKTREYYRALLLGVIEEKGMNNARMKVLEGLLRLRQISNHPRLVKGNFRGGSAKFELLFKTLETLKSEGHKALVFSQFVQMLKLVREEMDRRKIPYLYLDGHTRKRQERVDTFQQDPNIPFFLISLKAGGVGLNLTAADYVIQIDPWWNPAVEMQAADRTHRIGQDRPVFVYKLITRDSVEEKILLLQERKKRLVEQLVTTEKSFFKNLTTEDVSLLFS